MFKDPLNLFLRAFYSSYQDLLGGIDKAYQDQPYLEAWAHGLAMLCNSLQGPTKQFYRTSLRLRRPFAVKLMRLHEA